MRITRIGVCFFALLIVLTFSSCAGQAAVELPEAGYTLEMAEEYLKLNENSVKLMYPLVAGYADSEAQEAANTRSAAFAREMYEQKGLMSGEDGGYSYTTTTAEILLATTDFYSVYIAGVIESDVGGSARPFAYTINCDLRSGSFLTTEEIVSDYDALMQIFLDDVFREDFGDANLEENFTRASLLEQYNTRYGIYPFVYFRNGEFGVLVETLPSMVGYAGLTADIRDVSGCLNTENASIAVLSGLTTN